MALYPSKLLINIPHKPQGNIWLVAFETIKGCHGCSQYSYIMKEVKPFARCSLLVSFYSLLVTFHSLFITFCSLLVTFCSLLVTFYSLLVTFWSLFITFCSLLVTFCSLLFARSLLRFARFSSPFTRCSTRNSEGLFFLVKVNDLICE